MFSHCTSENLILVMEKGDCDLKSVILSFWSGGAKKSPRSPSGMLSSGIVFYWDQMLRCVKALHDRRKFIFVVNILLQCSFSAERVMRRKYTGLKLSWIFITISN